MGREQRTISAVSVVYFSDLTVLDGLISSLNESAEYMYVRTGISTNLYLVDNSENEKYFSSLRSLCGSHTAGEGFQVSAIRAPANLGYGGGNNFLLDSLVSTFHLVVNPDVVVRAETLFLAVEFLLKNADIEMISPAVVGSNEEPHHVVKAYPDCFTLLLRYLGKKRLNRYFESRLHSYERRELNVVTDKSVEISGGCFMFFRTSIFRLLGGFDDRFFMYFEDFDLSIRIREFGSISYVPSVKISHAGGDVGRKTFSHHRYFAVSAIRFFNKHGWRLW